MLFCKDTKKQSQRRLQCKASKKHKEMEAENGSRKYTIKRHPNSISYGLQWQLPSSLRLVHTVTAIVFVFLTWLTLVPTKTAKNRISSCNGSKEPNCRDMSQGLKLLHFEITILGLVETQENTTKHLAPSLTPLNCCFFSWFSHFSAP